MLQNYQDSHKQPGVNGTSTFSKFPGNEFNRSYALLWTVSVSNVLVKACVANSENGVFFGQKQWELASQYGWFLRYQLGNTTSAHFLPGSKCADALTAVRKQRLTRDGCF